MVIKSKKVLGRLNFNLTKLFAPKRHPVRRNNIAVTLMAINTTMNPEQFPSLEQSILMAPKKPKSEPQPDDYMKLKPTKYTGKLKWLDTEGFGYIIRDNDFEEIIVTPSSFSDPDDPSRVSGENDRVMFGLMTRGSNPRFKAIDVISIGPRCYCCKAIGHKVDECPERDFCKAKCFRCGIVGHYAKDCDQVYNYGESSGFGFWFVTNYGKWGRVWGCVRYGGKSDDKKDSLVCVKKREDVKKVEEVEDCFILEFDPYQIRNGGDNGSDDDDDDDDDDCVEIGPIVCVKKEEDVKKVEEVEDCFILEFDPDEPVKFSNLSLCASKSELVTVEEDVSILAENGQVACRDYPHPRHLCATHPFDKTSHKLHCKMCYCYICDIPAPCAFWTRALMHCHATSESPMWRICRDREKNRKIS